jgi:hypothetical protein
VNLPPGEPVDAGRGAPGLGLGWRRVADALAQAIPVAEVERIWLFPPVRRDEREWGTAVVARRVRGDRVRVYTASYLLVVRGRERGQAQVTVDDVGETPDDVVATVIRGVQERAREDEPPVEIAPALWWEEHDGAPAAG